MMENDAFKREGWSSTIASRSLPWSQERNLQKVSHQVERAMENNCLMFCFSSFTILFLSRFYLDAQIMEDFTYMSNKPKKKSKHKSKLNITLSVKHNSPKTFNKINVMHKFIQRGRRQQTRRKELLHSGKAKAATRLLKAKNKKDKRLFLKIKWSFKPDNQPKINSNNYIFLMNIKLLEM